MKDNKIKLSVSSRPIMSLILTLIGVICAGEVIAMLLVSILPPLSYLVTILLDSIFLLVISFPILYFFVFRKLKVKIKEIEQSKLDLQVSEAIYRTLVNKIPDGVYKSTHDGKFVDVNPAMVKILGYDSKEELLAIDIKTQLYFDLSDRESHELQEELEEMGIYRLKRKDGSEVWVEDHGWYNLGENGEILFHEGILRDITDRKQAEANLRNERLLLRTVIDNIPDSIYCKDTAGRKTLANLAELSYSQTNSESEILGKTDFDLYPKEVAEGFFADDQIVLQTGKPVLNREEFLFDSSGRKRWLLTSKLPLKDEKGNITGLIGVGRDVTLRRKAQEDLRENEIKLNVILQSTADGILAIDANGKIIKTNKRFAKLWNIPQNLIDSGDDDALLNFVLDQLTNAGEFISKVKQLYHSTDKDLDYLHFKDGRIFERYSAPLIMPDSSIGRVWSFRNITKRIRAEEEINLKNEELQKLNAEKDKFFSIIAHDLKGPFNGFLGLTQVMVEELPRLTTAEVQKIALRMSISANNLYHLLENLLEWSQIQKGALPFNPEGFQLGEVVGKSVDMIRESAKSKNIEIVTDIADGLLAFADMNMLQTIIRNLVLNAIKFTPKRGKISILAKATNDNNIEISIHDTGIGMSQTMVENLFQIDVKNNRIGTDGEPSTGLGLLLCKEFTEKNKGKIWAESKEANLAEGKAGGSTFYFTLPQFTTPESESNERIEILNKAKDVQVNPEARGLKILIADDDEISFELISIVVMKYGKEIIHVQNGTDAVEACLANPDIDLVLMDIQMPGTNGYEATRQIRQFNKKVIIIAQTAFALAGDKEKALEAGCTDYISKPINRNDLIAKIDKYITN